MSRALVTGGAGFAGSYLVEHLETGGHQVTSVGTGPRLSNQGDDYIEIDLLDAKKIGQKLDFKNYDVVFHLAGLANTSESFAHPARYFRANTEIQINLFEACLFQTARPRFVIVSSAHVYDPTAPMPLSEASPQNPTSPYGTSKVGQEILAHYYSSRGFEVVIARAFNHVGPRQAPGFIVADLAKRVAEAEKSGDPVIKVGNLKAERDYSDVRDIVQAYVLLAQKGTAGEAYNVCSGQPVNGQVILDRLTRLSAIKLHPTADPKLIHPIDIPCLYGDATKLKAQTGWEPTISLEQTLADTLNYWREQVKV